MPRCHWEQGAAVIRSRPLPAYLERPPNRIINGDEFLNSPLRWTLAQRRVLRHYGGKTSGYRGPKPLINRDGAPCRLKSICVYRLPV